MSGIGLLCCGVLMLGLAGTVGAETLTQNTAAIGSELQLAGTQWLFFEEAVRQPAAGRAEPLRNIAMTSERILQVMDDVTGLYAGIVK